MTQQLMTSHRTMTRISLFFSFFVVCIGTLAAYDLNHVDQNLLSRHRRQSDDIIEQFLQTLEDPIAGLIIMVDRSKYVSSESFHTEIIELLANVLRYHVIRNKVVLLTFAGLVSEIHDGFKDTSWNKCQFFEGQDAIWSRVKHIVADDLKDAEPDYKKAFVKVEQLSYIHTGNPSGGSIVILVVTAGDDGGDTDSNRWLRFPNSWLQTTKLYIATTMNSSNTDAITSVSKGNYAPISTWLSALKKHQGSMVDINLSEFPQGEASCMQPNPQEFCSPYTGSSFCTSCKTTNPQPFVQTQSTTTQAAFDRLMSSQCTVKPCDTSSCKNGQCLSPHGVSICYCNRGFTGTNCEKSLCDICLKQSGECNELCKYQPKPKSENSLPSLALIIPCAVGGLIILIVIILLIVVCCKKCAGGGGGGGSTVKKKKTPPPPPAQSLKPIGLVVPTSRPQRIRETSPEEDNLYAHYGKIPRHQNMPEWLGYIEEMVTLGHMEAAAIVKYDTSEWVCSERAFKVNQKEYEVLGRLLDKRMPNYKVKFKRKEYFLIENDGETLVMESFNPRGELVIILSRTSNFLIAVKVTRLVGVESAKNEVEWVREAIKQQEL